MTTHSLSTDSILLVDGLHGVYVPQRFATAFNNRDWGIEDHDPDLLTLKEGPHAEYYWESWEAILNKASLVKNGVVYVLHQEGDLYAAQAKSSEEATVYLY